MSCVLNIPDILASILRFTDRHTDAQCARVSKAWHEPALDVLWHHVNRLEGLFKLLGPMDDIYSNTPNVLAFVPHYISGERWERFFFYANRIRHLEFNDTFPEIHPSVFVTLSISRPVLHILPNITSLKWGKDPTRPATSLKLCLLFLAPGLKSLAVRTGDGNLQGDLFAIDNFFREVALRCPSIQHVIFSSEIPFHVMGPMLPQFLTSLHELKTVSLTECLICSDVVTALATCPHLEAVRCSTLKLENITSDTSDLENFMPVVDEDGFRSIRAFQLKAHLWNVVHFLHSIPTASCLRELCITTLTFESVGNVEGLFVTISRACPIIEILSLTVKFPGIQKFQPLPFSSIQSLLTCRSLTSLWIQMPSMLDIDDTEATSMGSSWPRLETLHLNPLPIPQAFENVRMSFEALTAFAVHCPNMQYLGICIQASVIPPPKTRRSFHQLKKLVLGLRDMHYDQDNIVLLLADITPQTCVIENTELFSTLSHVDYRIRDWFSQSQWKLEKTLEMLPMVRKFHARYRNRLRALEEEIQRLAIAAAIVESTS